jgi:hypothetical protein
MREDNSRRRRVTLTTARQFENTDMGEENARKTSNQLIGQQWIFGCVSTILPTVGFALFRAVYRRVNVHSLMMVERAKQVEASCD